jgi:L-ascorbate metabolism protein UlaG (beta-lactamase superfamily)
MRFRHIRWLHIWAVVTTGLLLIAVAFPQQWTGTLMSARMLFASAGRAFAQSPETPARLEWLGWQFFRLTSPGGKIILFNPSLNDPKAVFVNRESPLNLEQIDRVDLILISSGHADDQGMAAEISQKTGAPIITTFELANWLVAKGVASDKILRGQPGSRFDVGGIKVQVVNSVHGSGAPTLPGSLPGAVYGGPALGFIVTLETGLKIYHAGSTALTQDLKLYAQLYKPHVALLPIASGLMPDEAALAAEFLLTDNPNLHSVFPQHHSSFLPPELRGDVFVKEVTARRALAGRVKAFNPEPGQMFLITTRETKG